MAKYRIKTGSFVVLGGLDSTGNPLPNKMYRANSRDNVFESGKDMAKANPEKYERVSDETPIKESSGEDSEDQAVDSSRSNEELEGMTVDALKSLAEDEEIDVSAARVKSDYVRLIAAYYDA